MATTEVITPWDKLKNSVGGMLVGIILIPVSFFLVFKAGHREKASDVLNGALPAAEAAKAEQQHLAVYATGKIQAELIGDDTYIKPGHYLVLNRSREIYAWKVKKTEKKDGNSTVVTYDCELAWTSSPKSNIGSEKGCEGEYNPSFSIPEFEERHVSFTLNAGTSYTVPYSSSLSYYGLPGIEPSASDLTADLKKEGGYFYPEAGCASSARAGCERISYSGTSYSPDANYTVIGSLTGTTFGAFQTNYLAVGPDDYASTMGAIKSSDKMTTIILFACSVIALTLGLSLLTGPILQLVEFIPFIGGFGAGAIRVVFFVFSLVLMGILFILIKFWYVVVILLVGFVAFLFWKKKQGASTAAGSST